MTTIYRNEETLTALICVYDKILRNDLRRNENLAMDLLRNPSQLTSPIAIDKFFGIEISHGISLSFAARSNTFLLEVISDELSSGYLAISSEGDIGIILKDETTNTSNVVLVSKNNEAFDFYNALKYHSIFDMKTYDECDFQKPPTMSLDEINSIFHARTGRDCLIKLFHRLYNLERRSKQFMIGNYTKEVADEIIAEFIIQNKGLKYGFNDSGFLNESRIKYSHTIKMFMNLCLNASNSFKNPKTRDAIIDCLTTERELRNSSRRNRLNPIVYVSANILDGLRSANLCKTIRQMKIVDFAISFYSKISITEARILQFESGDCFVYSNNVLIGKYSKDEPMDKLDGIINDDYAFQLLEWRYVGQTTIIEPTPQ